MTNEKKPNRDEKQPTRGQGAAPEAKPRQENKHEADKKPGDQNKSAGQAKR